MLPFLSHRFSLYLQLWQYGKYESWLVPESITIGQIKVNNVLSLFTLIYFFDSWLRCATLWSALHSEHKLALVCGPTAFLFPLCPFYVTQRTSKKIHDALTRTLYETILYWDWIENWRKYHNPNRRLYSTSVIRVYVSKHHCQVNLMSLKQAQILRCWYAYWLLIYPRCHHFGKEGNDSGSAARWHSSSNIIAPGFKRTQEPARQAVQKWSVSGAKNMFAGVHLGKPATLGHL